jgi:hypothetical protein
MKKYILILLALLLVSCSENYSNGERIGLVTQFSETGMVWKSWEGHLNMTQTGMNSSTPFDFSLDNDKNNEAVSALVDSAAKFGWKVKLVYHEVKGWNMLQNRGETNHFINSVEVLDRTPIASAFGVAPSTTAPVSGRVIDTIYVVIDRTKGESPCTGK